MSVEKLPSWFLVLIATLGVLLLAALFVGYRIQISPEFRIYHSEPVAPAIRWSTNLTTVSGKVEDNTSCGDDEVAVSCVWACVEGCDGFMVTMQSPDQSSVPHRCSFGLASTGTAKVKIGSVCIK